MPELGAPLRRFAAVDTIDPDRAREDIGRIFCPHRLVPLGIEAKEAFHARHHTAPLGSLTINYVAYGARVEIDPGYLQHFYLLQIPLTGHAHITCGTRTVEASVSRASLLSPTLPSRMIWEEGCEKLIVLLPRARLDAHVTQVLDVDPRALDFNPVVDLTSPTGAAILAQARLMMHLVDEGHCRGPAGGVLGLELSAALETTLATLLLDDRAAASSHARSFVAPAHVRRAEDYIRTHLEAALTSPEVAAQSGCSLRSLQEGFRRFRGMMISDFILERRLQRWRDLLCDAETNAGVGTLALAVGLNHLSRAASAYRVRFGEAPSETRRRNRSASTLV